VDMKDYAFESLAFAGPEASYDAFRATLVAANDGAGRRPVLYVGANDGMLHAFDGNTGLELFAYMPHEAFHHIAELTELDYEHRYYVDGSPWAVDAYIEINDQSLWRTVLVGTTGAGGRAVFALDVTDPETFGPEQVLWEVTDDELGVTIGQATIARIAADDRWVALVGNGYNSASARAQLFVIDLASGAILKRILMAWRARHRWTSTSTVLPTTSMQGICKAICGSSTSPARAQTIGALPMRISRCSRPRTRP